jgi:hypothetical protein
MHGKPFQDGGRNGYRDCSEELTHRKHLHELRTEG